MKGDSTLTLILLAAVGYMAWKGGMLKDILGGAGGGGGGGGTLTADQACAAARTLLTAQYSGWASASCDAIKAEVCKSKTLLVDPSQAPIRAAFGCPLT